MTERLDAKDQLEFEHYRQKSFKSFDRRKSKAKPRHKDGAPLRFKGLRGNSKSVLVDADAKASTDIRYDRECTICAARAVGFYRAPEVRREIQLVDLIRPAGKKQRDSFEVVRLNRHVIVLNDDEDDWEDDWERIDSKETISAPSYAVVVSGKRRDRRGRDT